MNPHNKTLASLLAVLTPVLAFAQAGPDVPQQGPVSNEAVSRSPLTWYWIVLLVIAAAVFAWTTVRLSRRRHGPPPAGPGAGPRKTRTV